MRSTETARSDERIPIQTRDSAVRPREAAPSRDEIARLFEALLTMEMTYGQTLWILSEFGFNAEQRQRHSTTI